MRNSLSASRFFHKAFGFTVTSLALLGLTAAPALIGTSIVRADVDDIEARIFTGSKTFMPGDTIPISIRATNTGNKKVTLQFPSGQRYEFKVYKKGDPNALYTWSANKLFIMQAGTVEIGKGKSEMFTTKLDVGNLQPGKYRIEGYLTSQPNVIAPNFDFDILGNTNSNPVFPQGLAALKLTASADKNTYTKGETVKIDMTVSNPGKKAATINFGTDRQYQVIVRNSNDDVIWDSWAEKLILLKSPPLTLQPGESKSFSTSWKPEQQGKPTLKAGKFTVRVFFGTDPRLKAEPFTVKLQNP